MFAILQHLHKCQENTMRSGIEEWSFERMEVMKMKALEIERSSSARSGQL